MEGMNHTQKSMEQGMKKVEVPTLTLNPEERTVNSIFTEPAM